MSGQHPIDALTAVERTRAVKHTAVRISVSSVVPLGLYALVPLPLRTGSRTGCRLTPAPHPPGR